LSVRGSKFLGNNSSQEGGAIDNADLGDGTVSVSGSVLSGNNPGDAGGAIFNNGYGRVPISTSTLSGNGSASVGGAIANGYNYDDPFDVSYSPTGSTITVPWTPRLSVSTSMFSASDSFDGGAIANGEGVAAIAIVWGSTFSGNGTGGPTTNGASLKPQSSVPGARYP
jgi:hypothetical protein